MNEVSRRMNEPAFAELRRAKFAHAVTECPKMAAKKSVKSVKWVFAIFQLEPAAAQSVPTKMGGGDFTDFPQILRGLMGGGSQRILILILISMTGEGGHHEN